MFTSNVVDITTLTYYQVSFRLLTQMLTVECLYDSMSKWSTRESSETMNRSFLAPLQLQKQFVRNLLYGKKQKPNNQPRTKKIYHRVGNAKQFECITFYPKWVKNSRFIGYVFYCIYKLNKMKNFKCRIVFSETIFNYRKNYPIHQSYSVCNVLLRFAIEFTGNEKFSSILV